MVPVTKTRLETRTRTVPQTTYTTETRTRTVQRQRMETQQRTREVSYTVNVPETRVRNYNVTVYDTVTEQVAGELHGVRAGPDDACRPSSSLPAGSHHRDRSGLRFRGCEHGCRLRQLWRPKPSSEVVTEGVVTEAAPMATGAGRMNCN